VAIFTSTVINQVIRRLNELSITVSVHWTRAEIVTWLNDAITELNLISGELQDIDSVTLTPTNQNLAALASDSIAPLAVSVDGKYLQRSNIGDLDNDVEFEEDDQVASVPRVWCAFGTTQILHWPRVTANKAAAVTVLQQHTPVTDGAVEMPLRDEYVQCVEDFCVSRAMFKEGGAEFQQGIETYNRFLDGAQQLSGRNLLRRYPAWTASTETADVTLRGKSLDAKGGQ